jgi:hypothetical protein
VRAHFTKLKVSAESLCPPSGLRFAVKFVDVPGQTRARLARALDVLD